MAFWKKESSIEELEEENQRASVELSVAQKRAAIKKLKEAGLSPKNFSNKWSNIIQWLKTH